LRASFSFSTSFFTFSQEKTCINPPPFESQCFFIFYTGFKIPDSKETAEWIQDSGFRIQKKPLIGFRIRDSKETAEWIQDSGFRIQEKPLTGFGIRDSRKATGRIQDSGFRIQEKLLTGFGIQKEPPSGFKIPGSGFKKTRQQDSEKNCPPADHRTALPPRRPKPRDCAVRIFCWQFSASCCI
jgi:hypothetical protein